MKKSMVAIFAALLSPGSIAGEGPDFHDDYYLGFSQGAYYGLMLAGVDYHIAWCMKSELAVEARALGTGAEFQAGLEQILRACRDAFPPGEAE